MPQRRYSLPAFAARKAANASGPVLWATCRTDLYAPVLAQAGLSSSDVIYAQPYDDAALLAVIEDAVRDGTPSAIVAEASKVSMVATRRLQLVAAEADMPVLLLRRRRGRDQDPFSEPSAAWTRWRIGSAASARLEIASVGRARWLVELARQRGGEGFSLIVEGSDETGRLAVPAELTPSTPCSTSIPTASSMWRRRRRAFHPRSRQLGHWCRVPAPHWASHPRASRLTKRMAAAPCSAG